MTDLVLQRDPPPGKGSTLGTLQIGPPFATCELPWVPDPAGGPGGHPQTSCVPPGIYQLVRHNTPQHPFTWALVNPALGVYHEPGDVPPGVAARTTVLLHPGNTTQDSLGCILVGLERTNLFNPPGVLHSQDAFTKLKSLLPWVEGHTLTIMGPGGASGP